MMISVIGGGDDPPTEALDKAEEVGRELALRGAVVVCGGLKGVMEAACRGAKAQGGVTIGILPGNAVIAVDGAYGTLSEIAHALSHGIPVIGLHTWALARGGQLDEGIIPAFHTDRGGGTRPRSSPAAV